MQKDLWTEVGLRSTYRRVDATEAKKHWDFWYGWTEKNCTHGYTCSKCALLAASTKCWSTLEAQPYMLATHAVTPQAGVVPCA